MTYSSFPSFCLNCTSIMKGKDDFFNMFLQKKSIYEAEKAAITGSPLWTEGVGGVD